MKKLLVLVVACFAVVAMGCEVEQTAVGAIPLYEAEPPSHPPVLGTILDVPSDWPGSDECGPITDTVFPAVGLGDAHAICSLCTDTCESGEDDGVCHEYGALCEIDGVHGTCATCCIGGLGALRCYLPK